MSVHGYILKKFKNGGLTCFHPTSNAIENGLDATGLDLLPIQRNILKSRIEKIAISKISGQK